MKILKLFAAVLATAVLTLSGQEKNNLQITAPSRQSDVFFRLTAAEKQALLDRVKLVHAVPEGAVDLGDKSIKTAFKTEGKIIAGALQSSTIWHVMGVKKQQNTIVLKTAKTIDEIISGLVLEPDYLVLAEEFDPAKIRAFLLDEKNVPELYHTPKKKGEIVENYDNCATRAEGTNLRIMSYNILANIWGNGKMQTQYRVPMIVEIIKKAAPDFVGLQEVDMYRLLTPLLAPYKFIKEPQNMCAILYDSTKYRELEAGTIPFHKKISHRIRCLNWALFEALDSKKKIIVTNTHWDLTDKTRAINSEKMVLYITELQKKFPGVPIVCTGDFNTFTKKLPLQNFMQKTGLKDAIETAPAVENKRVCSYFYPFCQKKPPTPSYHIDHIIATDDLRPLSASLICGGIVYEASDHLPVIADFVWE